MLKPEEKINKAKEIIMKEIEECDRRLRQLTEGLNATNNESVQLAVKKEISLVEERKTELYKTLNKADILICPQCGNNEKFITNVPRVMEVVIDCNHNFIKDFKKRTEGYSCEVVRCYECNNLITTHEKLNRIKYNDKKTLQDDFVTIKGEVDFIGGLPKKDRIIEPQDGTKEG